MNSRQRRRQRRAIAPLLAQIAEVEAEKDYVVRLAARFSREKAELLRRTWQLDEEARDARRVAAESKELADHEIRKLTASLARQSPLVAELQIALRHIAQAASIVGADPGPAAVADVASVNELRQKVLAALKGPR
jgi:hypothetical protein